MAQSNDSLGILDLMIHPGFCVKDNTVIRVNPAAAALGITADTPIQNLLSTGKKEYRDYTGGCLYLALEIHGRSCHAAVTRMDDLDIFLLDQEDRESLQTLSLAARELRDPLTSIMSITDSLFPDLSQKGDPHMREQLARLNRGFYQMLRIIGNMSDAERYAAENFSRMEIMDYTAFMAEVFEKAKYLVIQSGITLEFSNLRKPVLGLGDQDMLERAILNLLSNSLKYVPSGSTLTVALTRHGKKMHLTVTDRGEGIPEAVRNQVFHRYLRPNALEDSRQGVGLGMVLIRNTATQHGGTVLVDSPEGIGTRVTMTLAIRENEDPVVRSPRFRIDYAGELDHGLVELAEILPANLYEVT